MIDTYFRVTRESVKRKSINNNGVTLDGQHLFLHYMHSYS